MPPPTEIRAPAKPRTPATVAPPSNAPPARVEVKDAEPAGVAAKPAAGSTEAPVSVAKLDHLGLAREAFNARDWARALEEGRRAVSAGGGAEAHTIVGNTFFKMGRFAEAEQEYAKAMTMAPANALLRERLRIAHVRAREAVVPR